MHQTAWHKAIPRTMFRLALAAMVTGLLIQVVS